MIDKMKEFEQEKYTEISSLGNNQWIVRDTISQQLYLKKALDVYNVAVFTYLQQHPSPHLSHIQSFWQEENELIVIEEYISGHTLEYILINQTLSLDKKIDLFLQVCDGVAFLHKAEPKIIHRDIKATNIMVTSDFLVKIIDYDAAKIYQPNEDKDTVLIGTEGYAAPEQYGFKASDERTDIYALGILMKRLFPEDSELMKIADKASSFSPEDRYQSVEMLKNVVQFPVKKRKIGPGKKAVIVFLVLWTIYMFTSYDSSTPSKMIMGFMITGLFFSWSDLFCRFTPFFNGWGSLHSRKQIERIGAYIVAIFVVFFFYAIMNYVLNLLFGLI